MTVREVGTEWHLLGLGPTPYPQVGETGVLLGRHATWAEAMAHRQVRKNEGRGL